MQQQSHRMSYPTNPTSPTGQPTPKVLQRNASGKISSYSPGHWKNYIANDLIRRPQQSRSSYQSTNRLSANPINTSYFNNHQSNNQMASMIQLQSQQQIQQQQYAQTQRQQKQRKKQQMLRRVKQIQQKVMPLIQDRNQNGYNKGQQDISWRTKMQQKVNKLQTAVDAMQKGLEIKLEKHVLDLQKRMMQKYMELQNRIEKNKDNNKDNRNSRQKYL